MARGDSIWAAARCCSSWYCCWCSGASADAEIQVLKAPRAVVWKDFLGVNAQFLWFSQERYNKQIDRLQDLGLEWVRLDLHWDRLETAEDQYQLASLDQLVRISRRAS